MACVEIPQTPAAEPGGGWLARVRAGHDEALTELIERHQPRVIALARAILKDPVLAEDATQETFLRVVQRLPGFEHSEAELTHWILTIARNAALDLWRKRRVRGTVEDFDRVEPLREGEDLNESPLDVLAAKEDAQAVAAAIETLPGPWREILVLRFFHHLEPAEAARVLGVSPENARIRLWRALRELRNRLDQART